MCAVFSERPRAGLQSAEFLGPAVGAVLHAHSWPFPPQASIRKPQIPTPTPSPTRPTDGQQSIA